MPFYRDHVYTHLVDKPGDPPPIRETRQRILPLAEGMVLEIGVGSGVNFAYYDPTKVTRLYALEPNARMIRLAERRRLQTQLDIEFLGLPGERIPLEDGTVDTVVSTFTLCTIPGVLEALRGIGRVLKPDGKLIFFEHAISPDPPVRRWQNRPAHFDSKKEDSTVLGIRVVSVRLFVQARNSSSDRTCPFSCQSQSHWPVLS